MFTGGSSSMVVVQRIWPLMFAVIARDLNCILVVFRDNVQSGLSSGKSCDIIRPTPNPSSGVFLVFYYSIQLCFHRNHDVSSQLFLL